MQLSPMTPSITGSRLLYQAEHGPMENGTAVLCPDWLGSHRGFVNFAGNSFSYLFIDLLCNMPFLRQFTILISVSYKLRVILGWYKQNQTNKQTPWSESASELYRPSDRRLSAKWLPTFADKGCQVVSVTDPYGRILGFLDRNRYFSIK
jgi:hypothetical protein